MRISFYYISLWHNSGTLPDLLQCPRIFSLPRATSVVLANRVSARIVDVVVALYNAAASVCDHFDIVYAAGDIVSGLAEAAVRYAKVYSAAVFASTSN
jgi:hypothetical protein